MNMAEENTAPVEHDAGSPALIAAMFDKPAEKVTPERDPAGKFVPAAPKETPAATSEPADEEPAPEAVSEDPDGLSPDDLTDDEEAPVSGQTLADDVDVEVKVDGETHKVKFKDLKDNYSGEKAIAKRIQQATEAKQVADTQARALYTSNQQALSKLAHLDKIVTGLSQPNVHWEELKAKDPLQYALKREEARDWADKQREVQKEIDRVNSEQAKIQAQAKEDYLNNQAESLVSKLPDMADPSKASALMGRFKSAAKEYGFTGEEVDSVMDHRQLMVLHDAAKYRELVARKMAMQKGVTPVAPTKIVKTGAASIKPAVTSQQKKDAANINRARQTGAVEDVFKTLLVPLKKKA